MCVNTRSKFSKFFGCVTSGGLHLTLHISLVFTLGFKLPVGDVNGPSLETFRISSRNLRSWGETGLTGMVTLKESSNDISMKELLAYHFLGNKILFSWPQFSVN